MSQNDAIRRQLGPIAPGHLAKTYTVRRVLPVEAKPNELDYDPDAWIALEGVVAGWIRKEHGR